MKTSKVLVDKEYLDSLLADYQATLHKLDLAQWQGAVKMAEHAHDIANARLNRIDVLNRQIELLKSVVDDVYGDGFASRLLAKDARPSDEWSH